MPRLFNFSKTTLSEVLFRQKALCAWCGEKLDDLIFHGHHVVPNQAGTADTPANAWLRTAINCVMLCEDCHREFGHEGGKYQTGAVPFARYYRFSHGPDHRAHQRWARDIDSRPWPH